MVGKAEVCAFKSHWDFACLLFVGVMQLAKQVPRSRKGKTRHSRYASITVRGTDAVSTSLASATSVTMVMIAASVSWKGHG